MQRGIRMIRQMKASGPCTRHWCSERRGLAHRDARVHGPERAVEAHVRQPLPDIARAVLRKLHGDVYAARHNDQQQGRVDLPAKEYSSGDSEGAENTDWKRRQRGRGEYGDVDIQVGFGFLNYINGYDSKSSDCNGYMAKSSDCVDFSSKEYSEADGEGAENTDWKRTYRGLMKGTPARNAAARLQGSRLMNA